MLFPLTSVMDSMYNLRGTKYIIDKITIRLNLYAPITHSNFENMLAAMHKAYARSLGANIRQTLIAPTPSATFQDGTETWSLF